MPLFSAHILSTRWIHLFGPLGAIMQSIVKTPSEEDAAGHNKRDRKHNRTRLESEAKACRCDCKIVVANSPASIYCVNRLGI